MSLIAVDLTPLLPGGANGGAKIMVLQLLKHLAKMEPTLQLSLICTAQNLKELTTEFKNYANISFSMLDSPEIKPSVNLLYQFIQRLIPLVRKIAIHFFPRALKKRAKSTYHRIQNHFHTKKFLFPTKIDLLFCPFTAPFFHQPGIPTVSIIYDLQYHYYPFFFTEEEYIERKKHFNAACELSDKLICISHFVKQTVLETTHLPAEKVIPIHIKTAHRLPSKSSTHFAKVLKTLHLVQDQFLLYPANFWIHKNHSLLFTAFSAYCAQNPQSKLKLVCTGAENQNKTFLKNALIQMGLSERIIMPGFLSDLEMSALMNGCLAVIFPSLYEGFGMPLLEAMSVGKPVLCSNVTSLPEVAGGAALLFDPRKPQSIMDAIYRIEHEPNLADTLGKQGQKRAEHFSSEEEMAKQYLEVFNSVMQAEKKTVTFANSTNLPLPSISIITPSYNQGQFIERTIQSVLSQNIPNLEYFVADGSSTDNTVSILKKYDDQIKWISEPDQGQAHAVNKGILKTSGEIIGWLNSDDIYYPDAIKKVLQYFAINPEIDIIYGNAYHIDADDQVLERYYTEDWNPERLKEVCYLCQPAVFFRRKIIEQYGLLSEKLQYCMDYEFWLRLSQHNVNFAYIPQLLAGSRLHSETKTLGARVKVHEEINDMFKNIFKKVPDRWLSNYAHVVVESIYDRQTAPVLFKRQVALCTMRSSLRWNKGISSSLLSLTLTWLMQSFFQNNLRRSGASTEV